MVTRSPLVSFPPANPHLRCHLPSVSSHVKGSEGSAELGNEESACELSSVSVGVQYVCKVECAGEHSSKDPIVLHSNWEQ